MNHAVLKLGDTMTVDLPGERIRVTVGDVVDDDSFRAVIMMAPMGKSHSYKIGDTVLFKRVAGQIGDTWEAVDENRALLDRLRKEADERDAKVARRARA